MAYSGQQTLRYLWSDARAGRKEAENACIDNHANMRIIEKIEAWLTAVGERWDEKPVGEKNVIALIGVLLAVLAFMQLYLDA